MGLSLNAEFFAADRQTAVPAQSHAGRLADLAVQALTDEAMLTPKPGLVDRRGRGAHRDLNWMLMCHSAQTLQPTFRDMALAAHRHADQQVLREQIGRIGRDGESAMMLATGGVNTHRGAIWALGLLVTAAAQDAASLSPRAVASRAGAMARRIDRFAPARTGNKGEGACLEYGVGGAKAQARAGFPCVVDEALPWLERSRTRGDHETASQLNALFAIIAKLDDTCVLARGGRAALNTLQSDAAGVLMSGGAGSAAGKSRMRRLESNLLGAGVSPGGAADLLAATLFLDRLRQCGGAYSAELKRNDNGTYRI